MTNEDLRLYQWLLMYGGFGLPDCVTQSIGSARLRKSKISLTGRTGQVNFTDNQRQEIMDRLAEICNDDLSYFEFYEVLANEGLLTDDYGVMASQQLVTYMLLKCRRENDLESLASKVRALKKQGLTNVEIQIKLGSKKEFEKKTKGFA